MEIVFVHADESCLGNQFQDRATPGGAGGLVETWKSGAWERRDYWLSEPDTTNNRMAIRSAIEVLRALTKPCSVRFVSDSQYLVKGINEWLELWKQLDRELERHEVEAMWVRGHVGHPENEYGDFLATRAAKEQTTSPGLVLSGFAAWLEAQRAKGRYVDYEESDPPSDRYR